MRSKPKDPLGMGRKPPRPAEREGLATPREMALAAARAAEAKLGDDILVLDLAGRSPVADYFVIVTGKVEPQLAAILREIAERLAQLGCRPLSGRTGATGGGWALVDYGPVVVHAFTPEVRGYYDLELLWGDAPRVEWREGAAQEEKPPPA